MTKFQKITIGSLSLIACIVILSVTVIFSTVMGNISAAPLAPAPTPILYDWEGSGDKVLFFDISQSGAGFLSAAYVGDGVFSIVLHRGDGQYLDLLVNAMDEYEGQTTFTIKQPGQYYVEVKASGHNLKPDWLIVIAPPQ